MQGEKDTLFNLNEAVATYQALQATGHRGQDDLAPVGPLRHAAPGEFDFARPDPAAQYDTARMCTGSTAI